MQHANLKRVLLIGIFAALPWDLGNAASPTHPVTVTARPDAQPAKPPQATAPKAAAPAPQLPALAVAQVLDKNATAHGGLAAWRAVQAISYKGAMGAGATTYETVTAKGKLSRQERPEARLPYRMELKRPNRSRLELDLNGQKAVQVFDGTKGWKLRPFLGRKDWEAYTPDEQRLAAAEPGIDGYLVDAQARGGTVVNDGTEMVDGRPAYRLKVTTKAGQTRRVWVDADTFLESRIEGNQRKMDGRLRNVDIYPREYRREGSIVLPHVIETRVEGIKQSEQIIIDSVSVNPAIDDSRFTKG